MRSVLIVMLGLMGLGAASAQQPIRFSHQVSILDLTNCVAEPGRVPVPLQAESVNLEIIDWTTGPKAEPFTGEFKLSLNLATLVGSVFVYGADEVQYEMAGSRKQVEPGPEKGRRLQILPIPPGDLVETLRVRVKAVGREEDGQTVYRATLPFLTLIPLRTLNVARDATVTASSLAPGASPQSLVDGAVAADENFATALREEETSEASPEWVLLSWEKPQSMRAIGLLRGSEEPGFGRSVAEVYTGEGDPIGAVTEVAGWMQMEGRATVPGAFRSHQLFVATSSLETRGLRIRSLGATKQLRLGEMVVLNDLGYAPGPVSARPLKESDKGQAGGAEPALPGANP